MSGYSAFRSQHPVLLALCAVSLAASACGTTPATTATTATADANAEVVRRSIEEGWNGKNYAVLPDLYAATYVPHTNGQRDTLSGPAAVEAAIKAAHQQSPDYVITIEETFATADRVVTRWVWKSTDVPTGKPMQIAGTFVGRVAEGKLVEGWNNFDLLAATLGTGATLTPAPPKK
ncbi:MAG: ester cyclase [Gemmatimonadota bacterium]